MKADKSPGQPENDNTQNATDQVLRLVDALADPDDMTIDEAREFFEELVSSIQVRLDAL